MCAEVDSSSFGSILIIGYGNSLRSDDAAGRQVAEAIAQQQWPGVQSLSLHQLTPELAEALSQAEAAIFVDAIASQSLNIAVQSLEPATINANWSHAADPRSLLALAQALYGTAPPAWWVLIPGVNFALGETLSTVTQAAILEAISIIEQLVNSISKIIES